MSIDNINNNDKTVVNDQVGTNLFSDATDTNNNNNYFEITKNKNTNLPDDFGSFTLTDSRSSEDTTKREIIKSNNPVGGDIGVERDQQNRVTKLSAENSTYQGNSYDIEYVGKSNEIQSVSHSNKNGETLERLDRQADGTYKYTQTEKDNPAANYLNFRENTVQQINVNENGALGITTENSVGQRQRTQNFPNGMRSL